MIGLLNKTATITPRTQSQSASGHPQWTSGSTSTVACALQTLSTNEALRYNRNQPSELMVMYLQAGTTINHDDFITIDSVNYEVVALSEDMGGRGRHSRVVLERTP